MSELKRGLGYWTILSLSIGSIMGTAIFFGSSIGARFAGNLSIVAWIILSAVSIYISMCFGELASMFPKTGGVYEFSKQAYGRFVSFLTGWTAWIVGNLAVVVLIVAAINIIIPETSTPAKIALGLLLIVALNLVALVGLEATSVVMMFFAIAIVGVIAALISKGAFWVNPENLFPFAPFSPIAMFVTMFFFLETYYGWEAATYLAEETKDPKKTIPKAMVHGTIIIAILGLGILAISFGVLGTERLAQLESPTPALAAALFGTTGAVLATAGVFIALIGSAASGIITMPRLVLALARDKLQLEHLQAVHPKFKTPHKAIIFQSAITLVLLAGFFGNYQTLISLLVPLATLMYIPIILSVSILRFRQPNLERPYKAPFGKIGPVLLAASLVAAMVIGGLNIEGGMTLLRLSISLILIGIPLYLLVELYYDPKMITDVSDLFSYFSLLTENMSYPTQIRKEIMSFLGSMKGKTVLEFGSGVGTLTIPLLREVGPKGIVYAENFSKNDLKIAEKRIEQKIWETEGNVFGEPVLIHDPEMFYRVSPEIARADAIVSVGMLGYIQDIRKILRDMRKILSSEGRLCIVEYSDFFHLIPSQEWLASDSKIEELLREAGFSVRVVRKKSLLWNRIFIYGFRHKGIVVI